MHQTSKYLGSFVMGWLIAVVLGISGCYHPKWYCVAIKNVSGHEMAAAKFRDAKNGIKFTYGKLNHEGIKTYVWSGGNGVSEQLILEWDIEGRHVEAFVELSAEIRELLNGQSEDLVIELGVSHVSGLYVEVPNEMDLGKPFLFRALPPIIREDGVAAFTEFEDVK